MMHTVESARDAGSTSDGITYSPEYWEQDAWSPAISCSQTAMSMSVMIIGKRLEDKHGECKKSSHNVTRRSSKSRGLAFSRPQVADQHVNFECMFTRRDYVVVWRELAATCLEKL